MALAKVKTTGTGGKSRWTARQEVKDAARKHRRSEDKKEVR